ncbi:ABC transporter permease [Nitrosomonas supralitoralis]|uniref:Transport permease protein n=1 Tax=Nitrosomonas supralitoralis TaxID=2116706 RepID=A0A2P7NUU9_9PROT|nr:ABC transporter permease [Nitrosomonas supralitoralis]PSJ17243.1 sugar ABC transporter permease [Nitrosomonas supralitoralis]
MHLFNTLILNHFRSLWQHAPLILQMIKREVTSRYRGSVLGLLWTFINPVLMLSIYTFVFSVVFKVRLDPQHHVIDDDKFAFALLLFIGLILYNLFSECVSRAPGLILANVNYVKKVIFPLEILPLVSLGSALFHAGISFLILLAFLLVIHHPIQWTLIWLPIILLPFALLTMGFSWLLASIGVFVRDISQFIGLILTMLLFMSPIFYPASALPESIRDYLFLNPLTFIIEQARAVILYGQLPEWRNLALYYLLAIFVAWAGLIWFNKTRKGFADVL